MMRNNLTLPVDWGKFDRIIELKGLTKKDMSLSLGWNVSYLTNCAGRNGSLRKGIVQGIESMYGIPYDMYKPEEPKAAPSKQIDLEIRTLRQEHYTLDKSLQEIKKDVNTLQETTDRTYDNTVNMRATITEMWQKVEAITLTVTEVNKRIGQIAETAAMNQNRLKEILSHIKGYK